MEFAGERGRGLCGRGVGMGRGERGYIWVDGNFLKQVASDPGSQSWERLGEMEAGGEGY